MSETSFLIKNINFPVPECANNKHTTLRTTHISPRGTDISVSTVSHTHTHTRAREKNNPPGVIGKKQTDCGFVCFDFQSKIAVLNQDCPASAAAAVEFIRESTLTVSTGLEAVMSSLFRGIFIAKELLEFFSRELKSCNRQKIIL